MKRTRPAENTGRVVALAVGFFATLAAIGWVDGVFAKLGGETLGALALFGLAFAAATYYLDREVRAWVNQRVRARTALPLRKAPAKSPDGNPAAT